MAASVQCRPHDRSLGMVMKEVDEDLAIFLEMRRCEKENNDLNLIHKSTDSIESNPDISVVLELMPSIEVSDAENLLVAEKEQKSDYDWLVSPPDTSSFPAVEMGVQGAAASGNEISNGLTTEPIAKPEKASDVSSSHTSTLAVISSSASGNRKPSSSGGQKSTLSRFPIPTKLSDLPATSNPSRSSTPTARDTLPSSKNMAPLVRSSTPLRNTATLPSRSSTTTTSKSTSRSATPTRKFSTPSNTSNSATSSCSSSVDKIRPTLVKNPEASRRPSPTIRSRPKKPAEVPISTSDAPSNLKVVIPKRPSSASRGRPTSSSVRSSKDAAIAKTRQKSCSPMRSRVNAGAYNSASTILFRSRGYSIGSDDVNPVLMGTKMVERVVNMRKLAPPKHDNQSSNDNSKKKSSSSQDNLGFGRSLSKKSLDMAIRHMDIKSINGNLNTIVKSVPASSVYSLRSGFMKTRTLSASDSPHASSSNSSSEPSANNSSGAFCGGDMEVNDMSSEKECSSGTSQQNEKSGALVSM